MDATLLPRAVDAGVAVAAACGLRVEDAVVVHDSNRLALHLRPCDVLARIAPRAQREGVEFEALIASHLVASGAPVAPLDPRVQPRVHDRDGFAVTLWRYYEPVPPPELAADEYAGALRELHTGMRRAEGRPGAPDLPHVTDRVDEARALVGGAAGHGWLPADDRHLVDATLLRMRRVLAHAGSPEQLLHGEPHPGNVLRSADGLLFVDLETCCRGPVEFDIAHAGAQAAAPPLDVAAHYPGADASLVADCWTLMLAMIIAWRCEAGDDLPDGRALATRWLRLLRAGAA